MVVHASNSSSRRLKQEDHKLEASPNYLMRPCLKNQETKNLLLITRFEEITHYKPIQQGVQEQGMQTHTTELSSHTPCDIALSASTWHGGVTSVECETSGPAAAFLEYTCHLSLSGLVDAFLTIFLQAQTVRYL
jgi:hypothetical protein